IKNNDPAIPGIYNKYTIIMQFTIANYMKVALERLANKRRLYFHRKKAHRFRRKLINKRGFEIVDRKLKRSIKEYAKQTFGSSSYWPWLALYTELRGEYKEGWLPKDYIQTFLLKTYNPKDIRICNYKTLDYKMLPDFAIEPLLFNVGTNMYNQERNRITNEEAKKILSNFNNEVVIKEDLGHGGHEITFIHSCKLVLEDYSHISSYVIQPLVHQHEQLTALNRTSLNTIRILTFLNKTGGVEVKFAFVRFGIENSKVDNTSSGGGFCFVNSDGSLSNKAYNHIGFELDDNYQNKELFESINIPNYKI